jgi:outer membrane cobalamin receptor
MQRALGVVMSLVCLYIGGMAGGVMPSVEGGTTGSTGAATEPARLDPVVVTGTQVAVLVSELPSAITVIGRQEIESRQITDMFQLLRTVPGLSVTQTGSRGGATVVFPRGGNALKLAFSARYNDSHFEFPTESAGDRLSPLDPDQFQDRQRLVLSLRTSHAITRWWEQILLLGYNRIDLKARDAFNPPAYFAAAQSDSTEQRLLLNYYWDMSLPEFYQVAPTWTLGIEAQDEKLDQRSIFGTTTNSTEPSRSQQGYYTQVLFNWRKQATLQAGVRGLLCGAPKRLEYQEPAVANKDRQPAG